MSRDTVIIVSPYPAAANNGNWRTAERWARMLAGLYNVRIQTEWAGDDADVMIALHARRSGLSIARWAGGAERRPLGVVLTGTDLHRDIGSDLSAQRSLTLATSLVVLHELGIEALPAAHRAKARVILQSTTPRRVVPKTSTRLRAIMVGHLREEKSPRTLFAAARRLPLDAGIRIDHVGGPLDAQLGAAAAECMAGCANYNWLGDCSHTETRNRIQRAHVLIHASQMEGGANVIVEALQSGTPVLASRIPGNVGLLGADYPGYFEWGDDARLAEFLMECRATQQDRNGLLAILAMYCIRRAPLFDPAREQQHLRDWVHDLLEPRA